ncbi:MAG: SsrA-binding protein SmpB [Myxococcota bacterium]
MPEGDRILIARNRRARYDYEIVDTLEAGIALRGPEVKSLRAGHANLGDAYASIRRGETYLHNLHISPYEPARLENAEPLRERKLLLHRSQIERLKKRVHERGYTLIPLSLYFESGRVKVELALVRGRRRYDKRQAIREREGKRETERSLRRGKRRE